MMSTPKQKKTNMSNIMSTPKQKTTYMSNDVHKSGLIRTKFEEMTNVLHAPLILAGQYNFFKLLSANDFLDLVNGYQLENFVAEKIANVFCISFVVVDKKIYNKCFTTNTLIFIGFLADFGTCLIKQLVINSRTVQNFISF